MKERPILFKPEMVQAILDGRKTMTRRKLKIETSPDYKFVKMSGDEALFTQVQEPFHFFITRKCPHGQVGDRLWVKEAFWYCEPESEIVNGISYATSPDVLVYKLNEPSDCTLKWKSPLFMPRWASRILLEITSVRVERLNDISEKDAKQEGVTPYGGMCADECRNSYAFAYLWESINGEGSWNLNPWVWVIEFKVVQS